MAKRPVHLEVKEGVACGRKNVRFTTTFPHGVTCTECIRSLDMADAEIRLAVNPQKKKILRKEAR